VTIQDVIRWAESEIVTLQAAMDPIGPEVVGYADKARYQEWCRLLGLRDRFKTIRGHLRSIEADTKEAT
jgi:hypothetical protein